MSFQAEKLYADLVSPDGTVCVAYVTDMRWGRWSHVYAGAQLFHPDGRRECGRATGIGSGGIDRPSPGNIEIRMPLASGPLTLRYDVEIGSWRPPGESPRSGLHWSVVMARGKGTLSWPGGDAERGGSGYVDRVRFERWPRRLRVDELHWGRVHLPDSTIVFTDLEFWDREDDRWTWTATWARGSHEPVVQPHRPNSDLRMDRGRSLHCGPALDAAPAATLKERIFTRAVLGPAFDDRRLSHAESLRAAPGTGGWAIHERVQRSRP